MIKCPSFQQSGLKGILPQRFLKIIAGEYSEILKLEMMEYPEMYFFRVEFCCNFLCTLFNLMHCDIFIW